MFVVRQKRVFETDVAVRFPQEVGGGFEEQRFTAVFELGQLDELGRALADGTLAGDELLVGWHGIKTEDGEDFPFSVENRAALLGDVFVRTAVVRALQDTIAGAREKNSRPRPVFGRPN